VNSLLIEYWRSPIQPNVDFDRSTQFNKCERGTHLLASVPLPASAESDENEAPSQRVGAQGEFVRVGYNDEGWVALGYRVANDSVGGEWMFLDVGMTLMRGGKSQEITRQEVSLTVPDGTSIALPSQEEFSKAFSKASLRSLDARANMNRDSLDFPYTTGAGPFRIGFFTDVGQPGRGAAYESVQLRPDLPYVGRLYLRIPGGINHGQHILKVQFDGSVVQVPFRIMTREELKENKKKWKELQKEMKAQEREAKKKG
jgi:hypothetical protein